MLIRSHADRPPASSIVALTLVVALLAGGACGGDGPTGPGSARPLFRVVAGGEARDTIGPNLNQALVVEIRDSAGAIAPGKTVRFEALRSTDPKRANESSVLLATLASTVYSTFTADAADSSGRAKTLIAFGTIVGRVFVRVTVPELGVVDTVGFSVLPGAPAKFVIAPRDTTVQPGANYSLNVSTTDRAANPVTVTPSYAAGAGLSVSSSGVVIAGTALARGQIVISAQSLRDTARVTVMPALRVIATRIANSTRTVTFVNADGANTVNIGASFDFSLSPHAVAASPSGVFYQGTPWRRCHDLDRHTWSDCCQDARQLRQWIWVGYVAAPVARRCLGLFHRMALAASKGDAVAHSRRRLAARQSRDVWYVGGDHGPHCFARREHPRRR